MAGKTAYLENAILKLIFNGTAIANIADNASASPATGWWLSLHTADPTDTARYCEALENVTSSKPILESPTANRPGAC